MAGVVQIYAVHDRDHIQHMPHAGLLWACKTLALNNLNVTRHAVVLIRHECWAPGQRLPNSQPGALGNHWNLRVRPNVARGAWRVPPPTVLDLVGLFFRFVNSLLIVFNGILVIV